MYIRHIYSVCRHVQVCRSEKPGCAILPGLFSSSPIVTYHPLSLFTLATSRPTTSRPCSGQRARELDDADTVALSRLRVLLEPY